MNIFKLNFNKKLEFNNLDNFFVNIFYSNFFLKNFNFLKKTLFFSKKFKIIFVEKNKFINFKFFF